MRIGILCAGDREIAPFLTQIKSTAITEKAKLKFHEGRIYGADVVMLFSGVCKVNAAIAAQILIDTYHVDLIINSGTAGALDERLQVFDLVVSTEAVYHDVAEHILTGFHPWMETAYFQADSDLIRLSHEALGGMRGEHAVFWGRMATGEAFVTNETRQGIKRAFDPLSVDMETASVAHVCYVNGIPFISIRCMTDTADHRSAGSFEENCVKAAETAKDATLALICKLNK